MGTDLIKNIVSLTSGGDDPFHIYSAKIIEILKSQDLESAGKFRSALKKILSFITTRYGIQGAVNFLRHYEISSGSRKPTLAIYDHAFHFIGGAQKYGLTIVKALKEKFDITIIANRDVSSKDFLDWYGIDLTGVKIKIVRIPYFEKRDTSHIDPSRIMKGTPNPFHIISRESGNYDVFINNSMLEMVFPLSLISIMVCHFPERRPQSYFYSDKYSYTVFNSKYAGGWIKKRWKYAPHKHLYPPVDMEIFKPGENKEKVILSVARLEEGGTKKQKEMASAFIEMKKMFPEVLKGWKFVIAGGSTEGNPYLDGLENITKGSVDKSIEIKTNISGEELKELYRKSSIFWHLCGLGQNDPAKVEHFGMTIGEAMQNRIAPVVFDGGGQKEIVDHGNSGYRVSSLNGIIMYTVKLIKDKELRDRFGNNAYNKSLQFKRERFELEVVQFFEEILPEI